MSDTKQTFGDRVRFLLKDESSYTAKNYRQILKEFKAWKYSWKKNPDENEVKSFHNFLSYKYMNMRDLFYELDEELESQKQAVENSLKKERIQNLIKSTLTNEELEYITFN